MIYAYPCRHCGQVLFYCEYPDDLKPQDGDPMPPLQQLWLGKSLRHPDPATPMTCEWCHRGVSHLPVVRFLEPVEQAAVNGEGELWIPSVAS